MNSVERLADGQAERSQPQLNCELKRSVGPDGASMRRLIRLNGLLEWLMTGFRKLTIGKREVSDLPGNFDRTFSRLG
jgi:hypothetical protein